MAASLGAVGRSPVRALRPGPVTSGESGAPVSQDEERTRGREPRSHGEASEAMSITPIPQATRRPLPWPLAFYRTAVGKKWVMAITGIVMMGFVFAHMAGNLHLFQGEEELNHYGASLRTIGGGLLPREFALWGLRLILLLALAIHLHATWTLTQMNRRSRPVRYQAGRNYQAANFASRFMRWSGVFLLVYIIYHLLDLTIGWVNPDYQRDEPYHNLIASLQNPFVAAFYIVAMLFLGIHLYHGAWSFFQSLGINNPRINAARRTFGTAFAAIVTLGFMIVPIVIVTRLVGG